MCEFAKLVADGSNREFRPEQAMLPTLCHMGGAQEQWGPDNWMGWHAAHVCLIHRRFPIRKLSPSLICQVWLEVGGG